MTFHTLGLDLSLTETGWAVAYRDGTHHCGVVRTNANTGDLGARLDDIVTVCTRQAKDAHLVVIEKPYNARFGNDGAIVYGAVLHALYPQPVVTVPPSSLKVFACGNGGGSGTDTKVALGIQASRRLGYPPDMPNNNEVDALWLATLGWHLLGQPVVDLPATHTRALTANWAKGWPGYTAPTPKPRKKKAAA